MCGLLFSNDSKVTNIQFKKALKLMSHRGPDYSSCEFFDQIKLGHNRLSIQDLNKRSNQPFRIGDYYIIFNGEML